MHSFTECWFCLVHSFPSFHLVILCFQILLLYYYIVYFCLCFLLVTCVNYLFSLVFFILFVHFPSQFISTAPLITNSVHLLLTSCHLLPFTNQPSLCKLFSVSQSCWFFVCKSIFSLVCCCCCLFVFRSAPAHLDFVLL